MCSQIAANFTWSLSKDNFATLPDCLDEFSAFLMYIEGIRKAYPGIDAGWSSCRAFSPLVASRPRSPRTARKPMDFHQQHYYLDCGTSSHARCLYKGIGTSAEDFVSTPTGYKICSVCY